MEFRSQDDRFRVTLTDQALGRMTEFVGVDPESEVGGILLGRYTRNLRAALVEDVTAAPAGSIRARASFVRSTGRLRSLLRGLWAREPRQYYLGEWHYHPSTSAAPSGLDARQMHEIAASPNYQCPQPILVIVGRRAPSGTGPNVSVTVFTRDGVFPTGMADEQMSEGVSSARRD